MATNAFQQVDRTTELFLEQCHQKKYPPKNIIIKEGDPGADLFYIITGSVTVIVEDVKSKEIVLAYLNPGDFFGEIGLFDDDHKRSAFVRAKTKCEIAKISYERLKSMQDIFPEILFRIASQLAFRLRKTSRKEPDAMTHPDGMQIKITRQELGRIVGCSREMVGRVLKSPEENHLITAAGKTIVVFGTR